MRTLWFPIGVLVASVAATFACNGQVDENTRTGSDRQTKGEKDRPPATTPVPSASCTQSAGSGSGGSDGSCMYSEEWECPSGPAGISCSCPGSTCTCDGETFAHDCTRGCSPTAAERARCGIPDPPSGGGSTSSGGSTSGGGSTSSSGG